MTWHIHLRHLEARPVRNPAWVFATSVTGRDDLRHRSFGLADAAAQVTERCFIPDDRPSDQVGLEPWLVVDRRRPTDRFDPDELRPIVDGDLQPAARSPSSPAARSN